MSKSNRSNYQYRSPEEWNAIFKKYEKSNLSKTAFCKENGIKPSTLIEKLKRRERAAKNGKSVQTELPDFIPVTFNKAPTANPVCSTSETGEQSLIVTIGKATITLTPGFDPVFFQSIASTLAELC